MEGMPEPAEVRPGLAHDQPADEVALPGDPPGAVEIAIANDSREARELLSLLEKLHIPLAARPMPHRGDDRIRILVREEHAEAAALMLDRVTHVPLGDASRDEIVEELADVDVPSHPQPVQSWPWMRAGKAALGALVAGLFGGAGPPFGPGAPPPAGPR